MSDACPRCHQPAYREDSEVRRDTNGAKARLVCPQGHSWFVALAVPVPVGEPRRASTEQGRGAPFEIACERCGAAFSTRRPWAKLCAACRDAEDAEKLAALRARAAARREARTRVCLRCGATFGAPATWRYCPTCRTLPFCRRCDKRHPTGECIRRTAAQARAARHLAAASQGVWR